LERALDRVQGHPGGSHRLRALAQHQAAASQTIADRLLRGPGGGVLESSPRPAKKETPISAAQRQIAEEAGVNIETIALAAKAVKAAPEVGPYLRDGKISVNRALKVANLAEEERFDALTKPPQHKPTKPKPKPTPDRLTDAYADGWRAGVEACARPRISATGWLRRCAP
jgi:hypothetical protein